MPLSGENQAFAVHVQDSFPEVRANRRRKRSVLETTMVFRTAGDSCTQVRAENASRVRISITGPRPSEGENSFEATAFGRSVYNTDTSVTITHHDVNLALNASRPRPLVRFVSVGPISEGDAELEPGQPPMPDPPVSELSEKAEKEKVKTRPVSAPAPSPEVVKTMLDAPPATPFVPFVLRPVSAPAFSSDLANAISDLRPSIPARPTAPLRIITNPLDLQHSPDDSDVESPLNSPLSPLSFRPRQFSGGRSVHPRRLVLDEPLPSLFPRSPSVSSVTTPSVIPEEIEEERETAEESVVHVLPVRSLSSESLDNEHSVEGTIEGTASSTGSILSRNNGNGSRRDGRFSSLTKAVKLRLHGHSGTGSRPSSSVHNLPLGRSSMSPPPPPPSAFQRFERRALGTAGGSSASLASRVSLKNANGVPAGSNKSVKALLGRAKSIGLGKGMKRSREEENVDPEEAKDSHDRPIAGRRIKRRIMGMGTGL